MFHANGARLMWTEATLNETAQLHFSGAKKKEKTPPLLESEADPFYIIPTLLYFRVSARWH